MIELVSFSTLFRLHLSLVYSHLKLNHNMVRPIMSELISIQFGEGYANVVSSRNADLRELDTNQPTQ